MSSTALVVVVYLLTLLVFSKLFSYSRLVTPQAHGRTSPLDALRGILATGVVCHHMVITYLWKTAGEWAPPQSDVLSNLGYVPVSLFFMITGFLFFAKVYQRTTDWLDIFTSRVLRIMPLYIAVVVLVMVLSIVQAHNSPVGLQQLFKELFKWLLFSGGPFAGFPDSNIMTAGAHWTLRYEWLFYLTLPVLAALCNRTFYGLYTLLGLLVAGVTVAGMLLGSIRPMLALLFVAGFVPVLIKRHRPQWLEVLNTPLMAVVALLMLIDAMALPSFTFLQIITLAVPFMIMASGNDLFGLLANRGLKALGEISYSLYLTHGTILYLAFTVLGLFSFEGKSLTDFIAFYPLLLGAAALVSIVTYRLLEKPFMVNRSPAPAAERETHGQLARERLSALQ